MSLSDKSLSDQFLKVTFTTFILIGLLVTAEYFAIHFYEEKLVSSLAAINYSGRQRMLSLKIASIALQHNISVDVAEKAELKKMMIEAIELTRNVHHSLAYGDSKLGLKLPTSEQMKAFYFDPENGLDVKITTFLENTEILISSKELNTMSGITSLLSEQSRVLFPVLDKVALQYQLESEYYLSQVNFIAISILVINLLILISLFLFVFLPLIKRLQRNWIKEQIQKRQLEKIAKEYEETIQGLLVGVIVHNSDSSILICNSEAQNILGMSESQLGTMDGTHTEWGFIQRDFNALSIELYPVNQVISTGKTLTNFILGISKPEREEVTWVVVNAKPIFDEDGKLNKVIVNFFDITDRENFQIVLKESEEKYRTLVDASPYCIHQIDTQGKIITMNQAGLDMLGFSREDQVIGLPYLDAVCKDHYGRLSKFMAEAFKGTSSHFEFTGTTGIAFSSNFIPIFDKDGQDVDRLLGITQDVTQNKKIQDELQYQASHDSLTGLINRREFEQQVNNLLTRKRANDEFNAMCFLDLDQFKVINDTCGHQAGDALLCKISQLLMNTKRKTDTLARLGGDEFGLLLEQCTLEQANNVAEKMLSAVNNFNFQWDDQTFRLGVSIGLVAITSSTQNFTALLKEADVCCYSAKELGRNRIQISHPEDIEQALRHSEMKWIGLIHSALEEDRFLLYAQPIVDLNNQERKRYEILIRMEAADGNIISPGAFLPTAEHYSLIEKIDEWVVNNAFKALSSNKPFLDKIEYVTINLSGPSLTNPRFIETIVTSLKNTQIPANKICFEVTETAAVSNIDSATNSILLLRELGCSFALDDFGTGLSSFGYLKHLPVDVLKIDGIFVKDIAVDPIAKAMVKSINEIGQLMGMKTVGEFVENDSIVEALKEIGVDYGQGYGLGKPVPLKELMQEQ